MLELKAEGWVASRAGKHGGYELARRPEAITMGEIVRYFDGLGDDNPTGRGADTRARRSKAAPESAIRFRRAIREMYNHAAGLMDGATLASVSAGRPLSRDEVIAQEFGGGAGI